MKRRTEVLKQRVYGLKAQLHAQMVYRHRQREADAARLKALESENRRLRTAWASARKRAKTAYGAWRYCQWRVEAQDEYARGQDEFARFLWGLVTERRHERDRYRLAWLSARKRPAR